MMEVCRPMNLTMINKTSDSISLSNVSLIGNQYYTTMKFNTLKKILGAQLENWFNMSDIYQRSITSTEKDIDNIANELLEGTWLAIPPISINIMKQTNPSTFYDQNKRKLKIDSNSEISLIDNFRMYLALEKANDENPEINPTLVLYLLHLDIHGLHNYFSQICMES